MQSMQSLDIKTLNKLLSNESYPAVTIYVPMHASATPPHISENQIHLKNLVHKAIDKLPADGSRELLAKQLTAQLRELHEDMQFWQTQSPGLLICASPDGIDIFHLPIDTEEYVSVDSHFHLAPILGLLQDSQDFYLLLLAQHDPKVFKGTLFGLELSGISLPANIKKALNIDELNQKLESQGTATGPSSNGSAGQPSFVRGWFNGRGGAHDPASEERVRFFRIIDNAVCHAPDGTLPLVLAGTDDETALYAAISHYPKLLRGTIRGNHVLDNTRALFEAARAIIWRELVLADHRAAVDDYQRVHGANPERVAHTLKSIREAAAQGRVDKLFARLRRRTADTVRDRSDVVPCITFPSASECKHMNDVALSVWRNSGTVYTLLPSEMPNGELMAARLRY